MNTRNTGLVLIGLLGWLWLPLFSSGQPVVAGVGADLVVTGTNYWSATGVRPGGQISMAVVANVAKPFHINANRTKENFIPTTLELATAPAEVISSTAVFPEAETLEFGAGAVKERIPVFSGRVTMYIPLSVMATAKPGDYPIVLRLGYQACNDRICQPPANFEMTNTLHVAAPGEEIRELNAELFKPMKALQDRLSIAFFGWDFKINASNFLLLLVIAAIGGMLLNFTPCVLPLIPIKIIGLSKAAGNRQRCFLLGATLSLGVVVFWLGLALAISSISGFDATNKLFQYPAFTILVGLIICAMAVGMAGVFTVRLPSAVYRFNPSQESVPGSFLFGIMTAVLSTPCTAPFMGAAAAWSATQRPLVTLTTFAAIGTGMALPYLILSAFPVLVQRMPRTGPASDLIKQVMGLFMLAAGTYFLGTGLAGRLAKPPDPPSHAYWWFVAVFMAAGGAWLAWRTFHITRHPVRRMIFAAMGAAFVALAVSVAIRFTRGSPIKWVYYTPERLSDAQRKNKVVVLEFTAAWCLNCIALEETVLHQPSIVTLLNSEPYAPIKVDITGNNIEGNRKLVAVGRRTIPYLVVYGADGKQVFASDAYTSDQLAGALKEAASSP